MGSADLDDGTGAGETGGERLGLVHRDRDVLGAVDDEGRALGLEPDYRSIPKPNADGFENGGGVTALSSGHYVVTSPGWDNPSGPVEDVGAVTWCDGAGGCTGPVTTTNSLVGGTANDVVGWVMLAVFTGFAVEGEVSVPTVLRTVVGGRIVYEAEQ